MRFFPRLGSIVFLSAICLSECIYPQAGPAQYERRELSIPVRDGTKLFAVALTPKSATAALPILLIRTPYSAAGLLPNADLPPQYKELAEDGYIFVAEDIPANTVTEFDIDMHEQLHRVWHTANYPSRVSVLVLPN